MGINLNGTFGFYDPEPTAGELVHDFIAGQTLLALALESAAAEVTGTISATEDADVLAATGATGAAGTAAATESEDVAVGAGSYGAAGTATATEEDDLIAAAGTGGSEPPAVADDTPTHSGMSNIQWNYTSMHRPAPLTVPNVKVKTTSKKQTVLIDADEEELIALGVL